MRRTPIEGADVWDAAALAADGRWRLDLEPRDVRELRQALTCVGDRKYLDLTTDDFLLPRLGPRLDRMIDELEGGRGVGLVRGAPLAALDLASVERMFWGIALQVGIPEPQDASGRRLHHVRAERRFGDAAAARRAFRQSNLRGYQTDVELNFHGDGSDALLFLCLRDAPEGGLTRLASAGAAFNRVLAQSPALACALQQPYPFDTRGELGPERPFQLAPIFVEHAGRMNILYKRGYVELAKSIPGAPPLTSAQCEAMDLLDEVLADPALYYEFKLAPGDVLMANNYSVLHARTRFTDAEDPARARHMLRIWCTLRRNRRPLPPAFRDSREFAATFRRRMALGDPI